MKRYVLSREVERDLEELWEYIAFDNLSAADRVVKKLFDAFELLARNPELGHLREDLTSYPVLFWPVEPYLVIYRATKSHTEIVAVVHGSRDIPRFLRALRRLDF